MTDLFPPAAELYPVKFKPIYQYRVWGGTQMTEVLGREIPEELKPVGESWEISDRPNEQSVIANGELAGRTLSEVFQHYRQDFAGPRITDYSRFPLLVKILDAGERLSLQVHPDELAAKELGDGAESKTEMWYILAAQKGARILSGLSGRATRLRLNDLLYSKEVEILLQSYPAEPGDAYFIPAGTLHAIDGGNLILEIQQNSDTTYRLSDWGRTDADGKGRELHIEQSLKSINFTNRTSPRIVGVSGKTVHNRKYSIVNMCRYFAVDELRLSQIWYDDTTQVGSFHILSAVNAPFTVSRRDGSFATEMAMGESVLIPYITGQYIVTPKDNAGETVILRTTLG